MRNRIEDVTSELDVDLDVANREPTAPAERWAAEPGNSTGTA
ncbi:hypothetical protein ABZS88_23775 [Streptomyces sp. NPDC005480]